MGVSYIHFYRHHRVVIDKKWFRVWEHISWPRRVSLITASHYRLRNHVLAHALPACTCDHTKSSWKRNTCSPTPPTHHHKFPKCNWRLTASQPNLNGGCWCLGAHKLQAPGHLSMLCFSLVKVRSIRIISDATLCWSLCWCFLIFSSAFEHSHTLPLLGHTSTWPTEFRGILRDPAAVRWLITVILGTDPVNKAALLINQCY